MEQHIDTSKWNVEFYFGRTVELPIQNITGSAAAEHLIRKEHFSVHHWRDPDFKRTAMFINDINLFVEDGILVVKEFSLLRCYGWLLRVKDNKETLSVTLHRKAPMVFKRNEHPSKCLVLRPIYISDKDTITHPSDIKGLAGFQVIEKFNYLQFEKPPIVVRGVRYEKDIEMAHGV